MNKFRKLLYPAIALMNHLKYPQKFALISCLFILPLGMMMYLLLTEIQSKISFAKKEILGNIYLREIRNLWADIPDLQLLSENCTNPIPDEVKQLESQINKYFKSLKVIDKKFGKTLQIKNKVKGLKPKWEFLRTNQNLCIFEPQLIQYNLLLNQLDELRSIVGDQSNLILDPDLDSYYLMDATLIKLPAMQRIMVDIKLLIQGVIKRRQNTEMERAQLIILLDNLQDYNDELTKNMEVAFSNNPAGNLEPQLTDTLNSFIREMEQLIYLVEPVVQAKKIPRPEVYFAEADQSLEQSFILWDKTNKQLDFLLQYRINGFVRKQLLISIFVLIILVIVLYLFISFYLGVMQTVSILSVASKQMIDGTLTKTVTLNNRDELAEVVQSFNNIAVALVQANQEITLLNQRLESENVRMNAELEVTRRLQQMILPKEHELEQIPDLDIAGFMQPATEVGGDYYDVIYHNNGQVKIGIGDVTGHGLESGVLMLMLQTSVRTLQENNETDPKKFLDTLNRTIYHNVQRMKSDKNLTLSLLDYQQGRMRMSGQHEEIIIVRQSGNVERIDTIDLGFPIGLEADITDFVNHTDVQLHLGDVVVLYTDGITEAADTNGKLYGLERLTEIVKHNWQRSAKEIRQAVVDDLQRHIGEQKVYDDITLVVMKQK